jgi:hypothetical protein
MPPSEMAAAAALAAAVPGPCVWSVVPPLSVGGAGLGAKADGGAEQAASPKKRVRTDAHKARDNASKKAKKEREKQERVGLLAELETLRLRNAELGVRLQAAAPEDRALQAERNEQKAVRLQEGAVAHSARLQSRVNSLAFELATTRAAAATAAKEMRAAGRESARLRRELERVGLERVNDASAAAAHAFHEADVEMRRASAGSAAGMQEMAAKVQAAERMAAAATAGAKRFKAEAQSAAGAAAASAKEARTIERRRAAELQALRNSSEQMCAEAASRAVASWEAVQYGSASESSDDDGEQVGALAVGTELAFLCRQTKGKRGAFPDKMKLMAAKWASSGASYEQCETMYREFVQVLAGGASNTVPQDCFLRAGYFQRKLKQSRLMFMLSNAIELAHAKRRLSLSGDGASDRDIRKGLREFFVFVAEVVGADGTTKAIYVDGALVSYGLTSQAEVDVVMAALARLQHVATIAKKEFARLYPSRIDEVDFLGRTLDISKISVAHFHHVKADGAAAAQKWARLLAEKVKADTRVSFSDKEWAALKPEERHIALWVLVTNCTMHNFHLGGKHACKATSKLTAELSKPALESIREAGFNTTAMEHAPSLSAATHTASKMWSTSESYAFGLAFFFKTHVATKFPGRPYIAIPRVNGSRFMYQLIAASSFVFMHEQMQSCLGTQIFRTSHSKIVSTMWAQLSSPHIYLEARVLEGMFALLFEPLQVMLGSPHSHYSNAGGTGDGDGAGAGGDCVVELETAAEAEGGTVGEQGINAYGPFVTFWRGNAGKDGACPSLSAYKLSVDLPQRIELAELAAADGNIAMLLATELSASAATADAAVCLMIDGGTDATPAPESCGIYFHIELFKCAIKVLAEMKRDPSILFGDERPSVKLAPFFPAVAIARLKLWENAAYQVAARDASGAVAAHSRREWLDTQRCLKQSAFDQGSAVQLANYVDTATLACQAEWEKVMKQGLAGELSEPNRTAWQTEVLQNCESHTMLCESGVGAQKFARGEMGTGSTARLKARAQASHSNPWELVDRMSEEEQRVLLWVSERLESWIDSEDKADEKKEDEAAVARKLKQQEKFIRAAAQEHADAIQLYKITPWELDSFADNLGMHRWIYSKVHAMMRQMDIIVKGYGHTWLAYKHTRAPLLSCSVCGCSLGKTNVEHLEHHLRHALVHGTKPAECPRPRITPKHVPPAMLADQEDNPAHTVLKLAEERAMKMATSGEVGQTIGPVFGSDAEAPTIDSTLVDQVIEYTFEAVSTATRGQRKNQKKSLYQYVGTICEVKAAVLSVVPSSSDSVGSTAKKNRTRQRVKKVAPTDGFASVRVQWTERFEDDVEEGVCVLDQPSAAAASRPAPPAMRTTHPCCHTRLLNQNGYT